MFEMVTFSEEISVIGGYGIKKIHQLMRVAFKNFQIFGNGINSCGAQTLGKARLEKLLLAVVKINPTLTIYQFAESFELPGGHVHFFITLSLLSISHYSILCNVYTKRSEVGGRKTAFLSKRGLGY